MYKEVKDNSKYKHDENIWKCANHVEVGKNK